MRLVQDEDVHPVVVPQNLIRMNSLVISNLSLYPAFMRMPSAPSGRKQQTQDPHRAVLESIALRHQIAVLERSRTRRPCFRFWDRLFWILFSHWWPQWRDSLVIVQPQTVCSAKTFRSWHETPIAVSNFQQARSTTGGLLHHARGTELVQDPW
jgi:hypothetical protein